MLVHTSHDHTNADAHAHAHAHAPHVSTRRHGPRLLVLLMSMLLLFSSNPYILVDAQRSLVSGITSGSVGSGARTFKVRLQTAAPTKDMPTPSHECIHTYISTHSPNLPILITLTCPHCTIHSPCLAPQLLPRTNTRPTLLPTPF